MKNLSENTLFKKLLILPLLIIVSVIAYWLYQQKLSTAPTSQNSNVNSKPTLKSEQISGTIERIEVDSLIMSEKTYYLNPAVNIINVNQLDKNNPPGEVTYLRKEELKAGDKIEAMLITEQGEHYGIIFIKVL